MRVYLRARAKALIAAAKMAENTTKTRQACLMLTPTGVIYGHHVGLAWMGWHHLGDVLDDIPGCDEPELAAEPVPELDGLVYRRVKTEVRAIAMPDPTILIRDLSAALKMSPIGVVLEWHPDIDEVSIWRSTGQRIEDGTERLAVVPRAGQMHRIDAGGVIRLLGQAHHGKTMDFEHLAHRRLDMVHLAALMQPIQELARQVDKRNPGVAIQIGYCCRAKSSVIYATIEGRTAVHALLAPIIDQEGHTYDTHRDAWC